MPIHASPGVYFETIDFSTYAPRLTKSILALVGTSRKGPTVPTFVSSVRQFIDIFGTPRNSDFSALAAVSFLEFGSSLWFRRLVGSGAVKASVEIPRANIVTDELLTTADDTGTYILSGTLNSSPVPGTLEIKVVDPNDATNYILIRDDGNGAFSEYQNSGIFAHPSYIDYDTGEYRFTLNSVEENDIVTLRYNYRESTVSNEVALKVTNVNENRTYSGILKRGNIVVNNPETFSMKAVSSTTTYTFTLTGVLNQETHKISLVGKNSANTTVASGELTTTTGAWTITFNEGINFEVDNTLFANYKYSTFKTRILGVVGQDKPSGGKYGSAYVGVLNTVVAPGTVSVLVNGTSVATDNGSGAFTGNVILTSNSVDYISKAVSLTLVTPPSAGFTAKASYMAKYNHTITTIDSGGTVGGSASSTVSITPIAKGSVTVKIKSDTLVDDGEGNLVGTNANGIVDYDTGVISVNYAHTLAEGDAITATYLSKLGTIEALYEGASYNDIKVEFYNDIFSGYGLKVWSPNQSVLEIPEEHYKSLNFVDPNSENFYISKLEASNFISVVLHDSTVTAIPILGRVLTLANGNDDEASITAGTAVLALSEFSNSESYDINLIACPDFAGNKTVINKLIQLCEVERGDCFAIIDPPANLTVQQVVNWHNGDGAWAEENALNSSFAALYYPWLKITNQFTESKQWVPPSVKIVSVYAYSDSVSDVWFSPAGLNRGRLFNVEKLERILNVNDRDLLYATNTNAINPICDFVGDGIVVFGQKTLQRAPTATDRVPVRRMLIYLTKVLATATKYILFEPNDRLTWLQYTQIVNPLVNEVKERRGLYEFKIICDETTNTTSDIDNNTMVGELWLKPTKTAERLINRFVITSTGATLGETNTNL